MDRLAHRGKIRMLDGSRPAPPSDPPPPTILTEITDVLRVAQERQPRLVDGLMQLHQDVAREWHNSRGRTA